MCILLAQLLAAPLWTHILSFLTIFILSFLPMNNMQGNKLAPTTKILILSCKPIIQSPALPDTEMKQLAYLLSTARLFLLKWNSTWGEDVTNFLTGCDAGSPDLFRG